jgi:methyl-accepting chemotaxis protein
MVLFLLLSLIPAMITSWILIVQTASGLNTVALTNQEQTKTMIMNQVHEKMEQLLKISEKYALDPQIITAMKNNDSTDYEKLVQPIYQRLSEEHQFNVFEIGDIDGIVLYRAHDTSKFGDNKSDKEAIQQALQQTSNVGFEFGESGITIRAFVPIVENNQVIGTLQTGLTTDVMNEITNSSDHLLIHISNNDGKILISSNDKLIGKESNSAAVKETVKLKGETKLNKDYQMTTFIPLFEPTGKEVIAVMEIVEDIHFMSRIYREIIVTLLSLTLLTILTVTILSWLVSNSFTKPIKKVMHMMSSIKDGDLTNEINTDQRKDEIGKLTESIMDTQNNLRSMIIKLQSLSSVVTTNTSMMKNSFNEISQNSTQITKTMEELADGAESQANTTTEVADNMVAFSSQLETTNNHSKKLATTAITVKNSTIEGNERMQQSATKMDTVTKQMIHAVNKMKELENQTSQINSIVEVIKNIANQTNLLALNAAIEAARAGEDGKGFAVVADQVRQLSEQVGEAVEEVSTILFTVKKDTVELKEELNNGYRQLEDGTNQVKTTSSIFEHMEKSIYEMTTNVQSIATSIEQMNDKSATISRSIEEAAAVNEQSAAGVEETTAQVTESNQAIENLTKKITELDQLTEDINQMIKQFKV